MAKSIIEPIQWKRMCKVESDCVKIAVEMRKMREFGEVIQALVEVKKRDEEPRRDREARKVVERLIEEII